jgi:hypothetical protein
MTIATHSDRLHSSHLNIAHVAVTSGLTATLVFVLCWLGTLIPLSGPTHAYIGLFAVAPVSSLLALAQGSCWSLFFGGLVGGIFAAISNALPAPRV